MKASELCDVTRKAIQNALGRSDVSVTTVPLADGGDGFLDCIEESYRSGNHEANSRRKLLAYNMKRVNLKATGPLGQPIDVLSSPA